MIASAYEPQPLDGDKPPKKKFTLPEYRPSATSLKVGGGVLGGLFVIWFIWFMFIATHTETMNVVEVKWERRIEVLDYQPRNRDGWNRPPSDAYDVDRTWRYRTSRQVVSHYRTVSYSCGTSSTPRTCTRQEAVYRTEYIYDWWYSYKVNRWSTSRWITTGGVSDPQWADLSNEKFDSTDVIGNEQLSGKRAEVYTVVLQNAENGRRYPRSISLQDWISVSVGERMTVHITRGGSIRSVDWK